MTMSTRKRRKSKADNSLTFYLRNGKCTASPKIEVSPKTKESLTRKVGTFGDDGDAEMARPTTRFTPQRKCSLVTHQEDEPRSKNFPKQLKNLVKPSPEKGRSYSDRELDKIKDCWSPTIDRNEKEKCLRNGRKLICNDAPKLKPIKPQSPEKKSEKYASDKNSAVITTVTRPSAILEKILSEDCSSVEESPFSSCTGSDLDDGEAPPRRKKLRSEVTTEELWEGFPHIKFKRLTPIKRPTDTQIEHNYTKLQFADDEEEICPIGDGSPEKSLSQPEGAPKELDDSTENDGHREGVCMDSDARMSSGSRKYGRPECKQLRRSPRKARRNLQDLLGVAEFQHGAFNYDVTKIKVEPTEDPPSCGGIYNDTKFGFDGSVGTGNGAERKAYIQEVTVQNEGAEEKTPKKSRHVATSSSLISLLLESSLDEPEIYESRDHKSKRELTKAAEATPVSDHNQSSMIPPESQSPQEQSQRCSGFEPAPAVAHVQSDTSSGSGLASLEVRKVLTKPGAAICCHGHTLESSSQEENAGEGRSDNRRKDGQSSDLPETQTSDTTALVTSSDADAENDPEKSAEKQELSQSLETGCTGPDLTEKAELPSVTPKRSQRLQNKSRTPSAFEGDYVYPPLRKSEESLPARRGLNGTAANGETAPRQNSSRKRKQLHKEREDNSGEVFEGDNSTLDSKEDKFAPVRASDSLKISVNSSSDNKIDLDPPRGRDNETSPKTGRNSKTGEDNSYEPEIGHGGNIFEALSQLSNEDKDAPNEKPGEDPNITESGGDNSDKQPLKIKMKRYPNGNTQILSNTASPVVMIPRIKMDDIIQSEMEKKINDDPDDKKSTTSSKSKGQGRAQKRGQGRSEPESSLGKKKGTNCRKMSKKSSEKRKDDQDLENTRDRNKSKHTKNKNRTASPGGCLGTPSKRRQLRSPVEIKDIEKVHRRKVTETADILKNTTIGNHASTLWFSENRRHFTQKYPDQSQAEVEEIMKTTWHNLNEKEKIKYYTRADNALKDENKHSAAKPSKEDADLTEIEKKMAKFLSLDAQDQHEKLRQWLRLYHEVSPGQYNQLMTEFKGEMKAYRQDNRGRKSKVKDGDDLLHSHYRKLMYQKILKGKNKLIKMYNQKKVKQALVVKENFAMVTRRLIAGEGVVFHPESRSEALEQVLFDLRSLEFEKRLTVTGAAVKTPSMASILQDLNDCAREEDGDDSTSGSCSRHFLSDLVYPENDISQELLKEICDKPEVPDLSPEVLEAHLGAWEEGDEEADRELLFSSEVFQQLSTYFETEADINLTMLSEISSDLGSQDACAYPSLLTDLMLADQFKILSKSSAHNRASDPSALTRPKYLQNFLNNSDFYVAASQNGGFNAQTAAARNSNQNCNRSGRRKPSKYDKYSTSTVTRHMHPSDVNLMFGKKSYTSLLPTNRMEYPMPGLYHDLDHTKLGTYGAITTSASNSIAPFPLANPSLVQSVIRRHVHTEAGRTVVCYTTTCIDNNKGK